MTRSRTDCTLISLPSASKTLFWVFLTAGFINFKRKSAKGFAKRAAEVATTAIDAVVVTCWGLGKKSDSFGVSSACTGVTTSVGVSSAFGSVTSFV
tara:strand:+ start:3231 stop:3518 length:288 start_codon:yes stop_codon:yes gene_type:complete